MQPYFMPYAGYFRLMAASDLFIFYDCVQFPRRGWVHRNKLTHANGNMEWLTLPLAKTDRDSTRIIDLQFIENAQAEWNKRMEVFSVLSSRKKETNHPILNAASKLRGTPCEYIINGLRSVCEMLGIQCQFATSSTLNIPYSIKAQDRILAIAEHYKATTYINAPGGHELYDAAAFAEKGIELKFLPDYRGKFSSILERLLTEMPETVAQEIYENI